MPAKLTTDKVKQKANLRHSSFYKYEKLVYVNMDEKVIITCPVHGDFLQTPKEHLAGVGCFLCAVDKRAANKNMGQEEFVRRVAEKYPNLDLSKTKYTRSCDDVEVYCRVCDKSFVRTADKLLNRHGCPTCGRNKSGLSRRNTTEEIVSKFKDLEDSHLYDFSEVEYIRYNDPVNIRCLKHNKLFSISPGNFISGVRCPECAINGYCRTLPGTFYLIACDEYTKIGITNRKLKRRMKEISTSSSKKFKLEGEWYFGNGQIPYDIETILLRELKSKYEQPDYKFDGSTEAFLSVDLPALLSRIEALVAEHSPQ